jgi:hypothetical protein
MKIAIALVLVVAVPGCVDQNPAPSISQGVYGKTTSLDDVCPSECKSEPRSMQLVIRVVPSVPSGPAVATVTSDEDNGFYELELATGNYEICTLSGRCSRFSVGLGEQVRRNYSFSLLSGWSE